MGPWALFVPETRYDLHCLPNALRAITAQLEDTHTHTIWKGNCCLNFKECLFASLSIKLAVLFLSGGTGFEPRLMQLLSSDVCFFFLLIGECFYITWCSCCVHRQSGRTRSRGTYDMQELDSWQGPCVSCPRLAAAVSVRKCLRLACCLYPWRVGLPISPHCQLGPQGRTSRWLFSVKVLSGNVVCRVSSFSWASLLVSGLFLFWWLHLILTKYPLIARELYRT